MRQLRLPGRVLWSDTDAGGGMHFTAAFRWAEAAEHALYREAVPGVSLAGLPRRSVEAAYHRPLPFDSEFEVVLNVQRVERGSISYIWRLVSGGETAIEGHHVVVHVGADGAPEPLPLELRTALEEA
jgi:acyl-CoA thioester hydrolase